jgi:hypothetical protein
MWKSGAYGGSWRLELAQGRVTVRQISCDGVQGELRTIWLALAWKGVDIMAHTSEETDSRADAAIEFCHANNLSTE